jgi:hypothetical protein
MMGDIWSKFVSKMTSTGVTFRSDKEDDRKRKYLPSFTFCPWPVYKTRGLHYNPEDFKKNTFNLEEIFYNDTLIDLKNSSLYSFNETWSIHYGRCHTINYKVNYKVETEKQFIFYYKVNQQMLTYFYTKTRLSCFHIITKLCYYLLKALSIFLVCPT